MIQTATSRRPTTQTETNYENWQEFEMPALKTYPFPYPPIELQEEFEQFAREVDKLKLEVRKSLEETQLLMDSLMQKYFG